MLYALSALVMVASAQRRPAAPSTPQDDSLARRERIAPPASIACPRNNLTSYNGKVLVYRRNSTHTFIRVRTDWETTEQVTIKHGKRNNPSHWFLLNGQSFNASDWSQIESRRGRLRPGVRANIWVCDDGRNPIVDWQVRTEN